MARRLCLSARRAGVDETGVTRIQAIFDLAMAGRSRVLEDERDPDYLHPGRTALVLLDDVGCADPTVLAAAVLTETLHAELRAQSEKIAESLGGPVRELVDEVPHPDREGDDLLEALVTAREDATLIALAERLDHARHLHLRPAQTWRRFHESTCTVYLPVAERVHERLARRYHWWCSTFARRFLGA